MGKAGAWLLPLLAFGQYDSLQPLSPETILLARIKVVASENMASLPNYTCTMTIERSRRRPPAKRFEIIDTLRLEVALVERKELFAWPGSPRFEERDLREMVPSGGAIGNGDFALHLRSILFGKGVSYRHMGEETLDGRLTERMHYNVPRADSGYTFRLGASEGRVGYEGSLWVDKSSLDAVQLTIEVNDIPDTLALASAALSIRYSRFTIAGTPFLLPRESEILMAGTDGAESRNRTTFSGCRQYGVESTLIFEDPPPEGAVAEAPVTLTLPPDLNLDIALDRPIDSRKSVTGDMFTALVRKDARKKNELWIPKGARVEGRIIRLVEQTNPLPRTIYVLQLERFAFANKSGAITAEMVLPGTDQLLRGRPMLQMQTMELLRLEELSKSYGVLVLGSGKASLPSGFNMTWRTLENSGEKKR